MRRVLLILIISSLAATGCSNNASTSAANPKGDVATDQPPNTLQQGPPLDPAKVEAARTLVDSWLTEARKLATATGDEQAKSIMQFIDSNASLVLPFGSEGFQFVEESKGDRPFAVIALTGQESSPPGSMTDMLLHSRLAAAFYRPTERLLVILANEPVSPVWQGLIVLHEGNHAVNDAAGDYIIQDDQLFVLDEYATHQLQNRLMATVGGEVYKTYLDKESARILTNMRPDGSIPPMTAYASELDQAFGPAASDWEQLYRQTSVWLHAAFQALDQKYGDQSRDKKLNLMFNIYQSHDLLPSQSGQAGNG